jgi:hypothetical protein
VAAIHHLCAIKIQTLAARQLVGLILTAQTFVELLAALPALECIFKARIDSKNWMDKPSSPDKYT